MKLKRFSRVILPFVLLIVFGLIMPGRASAALLCRADPLVILSNGVIIDFGVTISTLPWQVQEVHYELHVPEGVSMLTFVHTPAWLTSQETYTFYADQPAGQYLTSALVRTNVGNARVVADATLISALGLRLARTSASGVEGETHILSLHS